MNELFYIGTYEDERPRIIAWFLTNNAKKSRELFELVDDEYMKHDCNEKYHPLNSGKFERLCKKNGIKIKQITITDCCEF